MSETIPYVFKPHERPTLPGSPYNPVHPSPRRWAYGIIGVLIGVTGGLGNALVQVNLDFAQGTLGLFSDEVAWLTAAYYMTYATANLLLVKWRQQFGIQRFVRFILLTYAVSTAFHLVVGGFWSAVLVRAASGVSAAGLTTLGLLYLMQGMSPAKRLNGVMLGICMPQLATPLARAISPHLLFAGDWHRLYWVELGLVLATLAGVMSLPLPPSEHSKAFEREDFLTFALFAPGMALLVAAFSEGRIEWWLERAWIGWALAGSVMLLTAALIIEHLRRDPLINTRWLGTRQMVRLMLVATSVRVLLGEQSYASVGLMNVLGVANEQMVTLNLVIIAASVAGVATAVIAFTPRDLSWPISLAVVLIAIGAFMDADATNVTRPMNLMVSQALIGFASLLFLAQAMVIGIARALLAGPRNFVSFVVLFNISQSIGGLIGTAILGTFQIWREKFHSHELVQNILFTDPLTAGAAVGQARGLGGTMLDPVLRNGEALALLARRATREANVLAFNDVALLIGVLAILTTLWGIAIRWSVYHRHEISPVLELQARMQAAAAAPSPSPIPGPNTGRARLDVR